MGAFPGWDEDLFWHDTMHNLYLGTAHDVAGGCLSLLCEVGWYGAGVDISVQLKEASLAFRRFMKKHGVSSSCPGFTVSNCHILPGQVASFEIGKAAQMKHVLVFCGHEMQLCSMSVVSNEEVEIAATSLWALVSWIEVLDSAGMILSEDWRFANTGQPIMKQLPLPICRGLLLGRPLLLLSAAAAVAS